MSKHLFGIVVTAHGTASNNRGEGEGNLSTLQKLLWRDHVHTTVSAEAIRWAIRYFWQSRGASLNRSWNDDARANEWRDPEFRSGGSDYLDDDVLGFMSAKAAKVDGAEGSSKERGTVLVRRSRLEVTRAISLTPWPGDILFNAASIGATPSASSTGRDPVPYGVEVHATRYQYGFALTPESLYEPRRALDVVDAITELGNVAGNHGRFLYDFAPETVVFRWTDDFAPRMLYAFEANSDGLPRVPELVRLVSAGDIDAGELVVGGPLVQTGDGALLAEQGAACIDGVRAAASEIRQRVQQDLGL